MSKEHENLPTIEIRPDPDNNHALHEIQVLIMSAQGLKNVKHVSSMRPYALVYVEPNAPKTQTSVSEHGGVNPTWNELLKVRFRQDLLETDVLAALNVDIFAQGHVREKPVGSARVLLSDVLGPGNRTGDKLTVQVWRPSGKPYGLLHLRIPVTGRFSDEAAIEGKETAVMSMQG